MPLDFPSQIVKPPQVLSHLLCSGRYSAFSQFTSFSCCVSRCVSPFCLPGAAFATAHRPDRSEQWSCGGEQFQAPPRWDTTGAIDFPSQIVKSPQVLSHLLCSSRYSAFSHFTSFSCCVATANASSPFWAVKLWARAVPSASPVRHNGCHRFPKSNRQILWRFDDLTWENNGCHRFPKSNRQISTNPICF